MHSMTKVSKKPLRKNLIKQLDTVFSQYIRQRYAKSGIAICVTCGKQDEWKKLQAGHFMSRRHYSTRWDEDNVQVQCYGCNVMNQGQQFLYSKYLGEEMSITLLNKSREIVKFADVDLLEKIEYYKSKI
jgi:hypothetical protein